MNQDPRLPRPVYALIDRSVRVQQPVVADYVARLRRRRPEADPAEILTLLERQYLAAVTGTGAAIGGAAAVPGIGTMSALLIGAGESVTFLETSAIFVLAVSEVHGVHVDDIERRRALLLAVLVGESGSVIMEKVTGKATKHWATRLTAGRISSTAIERANRQLARWLVRRYGARQGAVLLGRLVPFGVGAAIGGAANAALGKTIIASVQSAFGPAPEQFTGPVPALTRNVRAEVLEA